MRLEDIGFYTLSDNRAKSVSENTPLWRCELILTDRCNFKCPYCRGLSEDLRGDIPFETAKNVVDVWLSNKLKNIRFSGGEPTLYRNLPHLVKMCKEGGCDHIAISTNGSAKLEYYRELIDYGVNDFSISLDGGCCSIGDVMTGGITGIWNTIAHNIRELSKLTYVTVGMVFNELNVDQCVESVMFADSLGVSDIRVIPSAQFNKALIKLSTDLPEEILNKYKILKYRINNMRNGKHVRGNSPHPCWLGLDDMVVVQDKHFPCIIYMREGGKPIGVVDSTIRQQRKEWVESFNPSKDPICSEMCLDVCRDYRQKVDEFRG